MHEDSEGSEEGNLGSHGITLGGRRGYAVLDGPRLFPVGTFVIYDRTARPLTLALAGWWRTC